MSDVSALDVFAAARQWPDRLALITPESAYTYQALAERIEEAVAHLRRIRHSATLALVPTLSEASVLWMLAAITARRSLLLLHPRISEAERVRQMDRIGGAELLPCQFGGTQLERGQIGAFAVADASTANGSAFTIGSDAGHTPTAERDTLAIVYTSGTSGTPKAAVLSRGAFVAAAVAHAHHLPWQSEDRWALVLPPAHVGGLSVLTRCLVAGRTVVVGPPKFDPAATLELFQQQRVTLVSLVPTMLKRLLDIGWVGRPPMRAVLVGGAPLSQALAERARAVGIPIRTTYGMTETCAQVATATTATSEGVGRVLPGVELRIRDGRVQVRTASRFSGYVGQPWPFLPGGWFETGDLGWLDDAGNLHLLGRRRDLIISGGENVYPAMLEARLARDSRIQEAAAFAIPDSEWGERVGIVAVGAAARRAIEELSQDWAPYERPVCIVLVNRLPRTASGKIDRRQVSVIGTP